MTRGGAPSRVVCLECRRGDPDGAVRPDRYPLLGHDRACAGDRGSPAGGTGRCLGPGLGQGGDAGRAARCAAVLRRGRANRRRRGRRIRGPPGHPGRVCRAQCRSRAIAAARKAARADTRVGRPACPSRTHAHGRLLHTPLRSRCQCVVSHRSRARPATCTRAGCSLRRPGISGYRRVTASSSRDVDRDIRPRSAHGSTTAHAVSTLAGRRSSGAASGAPSSRSPSHASWPATAGRSQRCSAHHCNGSARTARTGATA
jgi:hypothetical protein